MRRPSSLVALLILGAITLALVGAVAPYTWGGALVFQSPAPEPPDSAPAAPTLAPEAIPPESPADSGVPDSAVEAPPIAEDEPSLLPLPPAPAPVTPQDDLGPIWRSLVRAAGYVWLGCGLLFLLAIPITLLWLHLRGKRLAQSTSESDEPPPWESDLGPR